MHAIHADDFDHSNTIDALNIYIQYIQMWHQPEAQQTTFSPYHLHCWAGNDRQSRQQCDGWCHTMWQSGTWLCKDEVF